MERVIGSAKIAQINDDIVNMPNKYSTVIGERGVKLSGGQRQRIGLARAIYSSAKLLVLDEATSALDDVTESKVMNSIMENMSNMTIIMIAHRVSTLDNCNYIYRVENSTVRLIQSI
jgi:ATP-binding cassette subfamily B protein